MNSKSIIWVFFILVVLVQLYIPASMVIGRELVLKGGKEFRFRTAPIDPNDPFRGKYITLSFQDNTFPSNDLEQWKQGETVYVILKTDSIGYAGIKAISREKPSGTNDFVKAKLSYWKSSIEIDYPFDRFYMEEYKAPLAERIYNESSRDTGIKTYALVSIKDGEAVIRDVFVNGRSIGEMAKERR